MKFQNIKDSYESSSQKILPKDKNSGEKLKNPLGNITTEASAIQHTQHSPVQIMEKQDHQEQTPEYIPIEVQRKEAYTEEEMGNKEEEKRSGSKSVIKESIQNAQGIYI